jgi:hypothetical protein
VTSEVMVTKSEGRGIGNESFDGYGPANIKGYQSVRNTDGNISFERSVDNCMAI